MNFGIELVPNEPVLKVCYYAKKAEEIGADFVWITDHFNNRDAYVTLTSVSMSTNNIKIGVGVTNPYTRHITNTASALLTLNEISGGRAVLGVGPGDTVTFESVGLSRNKPLSAVRDTVHSARMLFSGRQVSYSGSHINFSNIRLPYGPGEIPIYIGAQGPKMLEMAGEIGDGVLINGSHPLDFDFAVSQIKKGTENASRQFDEVDIGAYTCFSIDPDYEKAANAAIPVVAFIVSGAPDSVLEKHNISANESEIISNMIKEGRFSELKDVVTEKMIDRFSITGDPESCEKRIYDLIDSGVTQIVAGSPLGANKEKSFNYIQSIIKNLKD
ncbi:MAG: 5,10-methylenetetrahydromethanopterin reductase [Methanosarcinaceae archaeon]|nr:5,10-methylenetetrahydromethanopterin reductase [Methanosarcinaceae archaeon]